MSCWYEKDAEARHEGVVSEFEEILSNVSTVSRINDADLYSKLIDARSLKSHYGARDEWNARSLTERLLSTNICRRAKETIASKVVKNRTRVQVLTDGGSPKQQRQAKQMTKFINGVLQEQGAHAEGAKAHGDCATFGVGYVFVYADEDCAKIRVEHAPYHEVFVNPAEAAYGKPRNLYRYKRVHCDVLCKQFPEYEDEIMSSSINIGKLGVQTVSEEDMVDVLEAWHLPSGKDTEDGRHVIVVSGATLVDEEWKYDWFPVAVLRWEHDKANWYVDGIGARNYATQVEINELDNRISNMQAIVARARILVDRDSNFEYDKMADEDGQILFYSNTRPEIWSQSVVPRELYEHRETLKAEIYENEGVSQMSAGAKKPPGIEAAVALRELGDLETERLSRHAQAWEEFFVDIGELVMRVGKDFYEDAGKDVIVKAPGSNFLEEVKWSEIDWDEDMYQVSRHGTSALPQTVAYRKQYVTELVTEGYIDQNQAKVLLDLPDIEGAWDRATAGYRDALAHVENIIETGEYEAPEPYQDIGTMADYAQFMYYEGRRKKFEEEDMRNIRKLLQELVSMGAKGGDTALQGGPAPAPNATPEQAMAQMAPGAPPPQPGMPQQPMPPAPTPTPLPQPGAGGAPLPGIPPQRA